MRDLDAAWGWYAAVRAGMQKLEHLAEFWDDLPWEQDAGWVARLKGDNILKHATGTEMAGEAKRVRSEIDDLAVLVLFSVFEAEVRDQVEQQVRPEIDRLAHPAMKKAGEGVLQAVTEGSFFRVLEPFKSAASPDLVEQVNQVRHYRNWVAHGRRPDRRPGALIKPRDAYDRLREFLNAVRPPTPSAVEEP